MDIQSSMPQFSFCSILTTRKMVFGDEQLSSPKLFISSLELFGDEPGFVTLCLSLNDLVTKCFVIKCILYNQRKNQLVTHMFHHLMFSSPNILFVDKIFRHQISLFFIFFIKLWSDDFHFVT